MNPTNKRRIFLGTLIGFLAVSPFVIRGLRKSKILHESALKHTYSSNISTSGKIEIGQAHFTPFELPKKNIKYNSILACIAADSSIAVISYSFSENWNSEICQIPLTKQGLSPKVSVLCEFAPQTLLTSLSCSGRLSTKNQHIAYVKRFCKPSDDINAVCDENLYVAPIQSDSRIDVGQSISVLEKPAGVGVYKKYFHGLMGQNPQCWINGKDRFLYGGPLDVHEVCMNTDKMLSIKSINKIYNLATDQEIPDDKFGRVKRTGNVIGSNFVDNGDGTVRFIEFPWLQKKSQNLKGGIPARSFDVNEGSLVTIDLNGNVIEKRPFYSLPNGTLALVTRTHWCFTDLTSHQFIIAASLEKPKEYFVFRFPDDQVEDKKSKINYAFKIHSLHPSGKHLLASRYPMGDLAKLEKMGIPACEFGLIELPISLGPRIP